MVGFNKYSSIENHYQSKFIDSFVSQKPELLNMKYYIEEKIHGSNFQIIVTKDTVQYGKRTSLLGEEKFFNYKEVVAREYIVELVEKVQTFIEGAPNGIDEIILYAELYGRGIQKEVYYRDDQDLLFFDVKSDGVFLGPEEFRVFMDNMGASSLCVPLLAVVDSIEEALDYDVIFDSKVANKKDNKAEGVVIKPAVPQFRNDDKRFIIKKKNPKFKENEGGAVKKASKVVVLSTLQIAFSRYLNENRVAGVMSKYGEIEEPSQIGEYIKHVFADALEDFKKENEEYEELSDDNVKKLGKIVGRVVAPMIKTYL